MPKTATSTTPRPGTEIEIEGTVLTLWSGAPRVRHFWALVNESGEARLVQADKTWTVWSFDDKPMVHYRPGMRVVSRHVKGRLYEGTVTGTNYRGGISGSDEHGSIYVEFDHPIYRGWPISSKYLSPLG